MQISAQFGKISGLDWSRPWVFWLGHKYKSRLEQTRPDIFPNRAKTCTIPYKDCVVWYGGFSKGVTKLGEKNLLIKLTDTIKHKLRIDHKLFTVDGKIILISIP